MLPDIALTVSRASAVCPAIGSLEFSTTMSWSEATLVGMVADSFPPRSRATRAARLQRGFPTPGHRPVTASSQSCHTWLKTNPPIERWPYLRSMAGYDLEVIRLEPGTHPRSPDGCLMEWVALVSGLPKTDRPRCVNELVTAVAIHLNDSLDDLSRQRLKPLIP